MSLLTTWPESGPETLVRRTSDPAEIAAALAPIGVRYEQWPVREEVPVDADSDTVFAVYGAEIEKLNAEEGFTTVDVLGLHPSDDPEYPVRAKAARAKFLQDTHDDDDEVRFFVSGSGSSTSTSAARCTPCCARRAICWACRAVRRTGSTWVRRRRSPRSGSSTRRTAGSELHR